MSDSHSVSPFFIIWLILLCFTGYFWRYLIHTLPRSKSRLFRFFLFLLYPFVSFLNLFCFSLSLRTFPYIDFGFYFSIAIPTVTFWISLLIFTFGIVKTAIAVVFLTHKRFRLRSALRAFWPFTIALLPMHTAFAAAYSSFAGIVASLAIVPLVGWQVYVLPEKKDKRARAKWE
jgi:hypothetical protein